MPEWRKDPVVGRWVIISTERSKRPTDYLTATESAQECICPLCEGQEEKTPPEVLAFREKNTQPNNPGWWVRVVPNKFPAVKVEGDIDHHRHGIYEVMNGLGAHEVVVETSAHTTAMHEVSPHQMAEIIWAWRYRMLDLRCDQRFRYILLFKNYGSAGGASLEHSHSQIIATPMVPMDVIEEIQGANEYHRLMNRCVYCDMVEQELEEDRRVITANSHFLAFCPFASRFPFETWIIPQRHQSDFALMDEDMIHSLSGIFLDVLNSMIDTLHNPPYNMVVHTTPVNGPEESGYHWHIEILPRLTKLAGFELGTGYYINPTPPELAAQSLKKDGRMVHRLEAREEMSYYV